MDGTTVMTVLSEKEQLKIELDTLRREHRVLDQEIADIHAAPGTDALALSRLKKRKLLLKDRIARIEDQLYPDIIA